MLSNCEKMAAISSTSTNEWPQNQQIDEKNLMAATGNRLMEKQEPPQQQQLLKCPRCDSSNTKFCYYNNYSLSQPRHFCKACKRYWTRGGTLRNVPVGGGCRKNKRVKRPSNTATSTTSNASSIDHNNGSSSSSAAAAANPSNPKYTQTHQPHFDLNPLFYGLSSTTNPSHDHHNHYYHHINLPFSRFNSSRVDGSSTVVDTVSGGYEQLTAIGLGFPETAAVSSANSLLSSYPNYNKFGGSSSSSASPTMASLLASATLHHSEQNNKFMNGGVLKSNTQALNHFNNLASFEDLRMTAADNGVEEAARIGLGTKVEDGQNRSSNSNMDWDHHHHHHQMEHLGLAADPNALFWNSSTNPSVGGGAWHDPSNIGSSVTSLI